MQKTLILSCFFLFFSSCSFKKNAEQKNEAKSNTTTIYETKPNEEKQIEEALLSSVTNDSLEDVADLIQKYNNPNLNFTDKDGRSPLSVAFDRQRNDIIKLLLTKGASLYWKNKDNGFLSENLQRLEKIYLLKQNKENLESDRIERLSYEVSELGENAIDSHETTNKEPVFFIMKITKDINFIADALKQKQSDKILSYSKKENISCEESLALVFSAIQMNPDIDLQAASVIFDNLACKKITDPDLSYDLYSFEWFRQYKMNFTSADLLQRIVDSTNLATKNLTYDPSVGGFVTFDPFIVLDANPAGAKNKDKFSYFGNFGDHKITIYGAGKSSVKDITIPKDFNPDGLSIEDQQNAYLWNCFVAPQMGEEDCSENLLSHLVPTDESQNL